MNYELTVRPEAEREIDEAFNWYEDQSAGLGKEFLRAIEAALFTTIRNPLVYQLIHTGKFEGFFYDDFRMRYFISLRNNE